jgi:hypothetical protein
MVNSDSHAATNGESTFAVILLPGEGAPPAELAGALGSLSEAFEHAAEWLDREDASRAGTVKLAIIEDRGGAISTVWSYPPEHMPATAGAGLVQVFGFDPVHWNPQAARGRVSPSPGSSDRLPSNPPPPPAFRHESYAEGDEPAPTIAVGPPPHREPAGALSRLNARRTLRITWEDRVLRTFLVMSAASLWLTVTLTEPRFLVVFLLALCAGTWWHRLRARASVGSETDIDDWL